MNLESIIADLLIVDFTEYHKEHPDEILPSHGVLFIEQPDKRLGAFCMLNPHHLPFEAINLEKQPILVTDSHGCLVQQCECICRAQRGIGKKWVLLLELKYCKKGNININMRNALYKLDKCYDFLKNEKHFFDDNSYRVYLCASHPEHNMIQPFESFFNNQDTIISLNEKGVKLLYCNAVKILTPEYLQKAEVPRRYLADRDV